MKVIPIILRLPKRRLIIHGDNPMVILPKSFYASGDVVALAKLLLGKVLVTNFNGIKTSGRIVETEAYKAPEDKASHAYNNRKTKRTEVMFGPPGHAYIYLCYGIHHLFNVVTGPAGVAHAVLIRALEPLGNLMAMKQRRNQERINKLTNGPGILSQAMGIFTEHSGLSLLNEQDEIWIEDHKETIADTNILASPRVGIDYAEECALWPWRFRIKDNDFTSNAK